MNATQRKQAASIADRLRAVVLELESLHDELDQLTGDERDKFDNMPEGLQQSERGQATQQAADDMEEVAGEVQQAMDSAQEAIYKLEELS